jgi:HK97 family phage major capsid protein
MSPKLVKINGKSYLKDGENLEEVVSQEPISEGTTVEVEEPASEANLDSAAEKAADAIMAKLPLGELSEAIRKLSETNITSKAQEIVGKELTKEDVAKMAPREKIAKFFKAVITRDNVSAKALSEGTAADGGYLFPDEFRAEIIRDIVEKFSMRSLVRVVPMNRDVMKIPTLTSGPKVSWTEENATKSTTTASFNEATLTVKKMAAILYSSDELIEDSSEIDVVDLIVTLFSEALQREEDRVITVGNGTTQPTGLTTAVTATTIQSITCSGNLSFDNIINLEYALPMKYHPNAVFLVHRNNIREMRKLKDSNNRYYWSEPVAAGQPATFHGYPVIENNNLPESTILFGDFKMGYWLGDRKSMSVKITQDTETAFTKDQTAIRVVQRIAGNVVLGDAIKALTSIP